MKLYQNTSEYIINAKITCLTEKLKKYTSFELPYSNLDDLVKIQLKIKSLKSELKNIKNCNTIKH